MIELVSIYVDDSNPAWSIEESHTLSNILILVAHGSVIYTLNGESITVAKGDFLYIPKGVLRAGRNSLEGAHQKYSVHFMIEQSDLFPLGTDRPYWKISVRNFDYLKQRFLVLAKHWFSRKKHDELICTGIAMELFGYFAQETEEKQFASIKLRLMREVQDYILAHYRKLIRIQELAELVDRAPNYVTQTFKEVTGMTPVTYLHQVRIHAARDLILNTKLTLGEIADYLGYSDQAHFHRVFKKVMGYPPSSAQREIMRIQG
ncbi:AraC family transcriptional regulator [Paenibacillus sp. HWE-109]|uniref:AraC family transcriptional regulator n=1 Tax=Paenibacillus sp. HWE-109 TaxID=1306526 RepID=UPI001EE080D5|nr:AraC family transcriptional regulator [Paenibacillus sp. HWE-109]UKS28261.1 AraC family transcriptional regulator [Paenibacillus sp. HWE-109]